METQKRSQQGKLPWLVDYFKLSLLDKYLSKNNKNTF